MIIAAEITEVNEYKTRRHSSGFGASAGFEEHLSGWIVRLNIGGTIVSLILQDKPSLSVGPVLLEIKPR